jgi:Zn-dependent peptidase ImmA (M78 family)/DNA-binding XRE family transcriptional regulator
MTGTVNGEMLQLARESRGLTQGSLARLTSISQSKISKYERDNLPISENDLAQLATVLQYPKSFFHNQLKAHGFGVSGVFHRRRQSIPMLTLKKIQAEFNIRTMEIEKLLEGAEIKSENEFHRLDIEDFDGDAEYIAELVRAQWNLPLGPIKSIIGVIESAGGIVLKYDMGTRKLDAQSRWISGLPPIFFANENIPVDRLRFTLAHEIGHVIMHRIPTKNIEDEANRFASSFLMPRREIIHDLTHFSLERAVRLKLKWKVSIAALIMRAFDLGILTISQKRRFFTLMGAAGYRTSEPVTLPDDEKSATVRQLIDVYKKEHNYTTAELCNMLSVNEFDFRVFYLQAPPLRIHKLKN